MKSGIPKGLGRGLPRTVGFFSAGSSASTSADTPLRMSCSNSVATFQPSDSKRAWAKALRSRIPGSSPQNLPMMRMTILYSRKVNSGAKSGMSRDSEGESPSK